MEADTIAITGTNGKTTTTALTGAHPAPSSRGPCWSGGNIGTPLAAHALDVPARRPRGLPRRRAFSSRRPSASSRGSPRCSTSRPTTWTGTARSSATWKPRRGSSRTRRPSDCAVLNADDAATRGAGRRARARRVVVVQPPAPVDARRVRPRRLGGGAAQRPRRADLRRWPRSPARRAQRGERAGGHRVRAVDGRGAGGDPRGHRPLPAASRTASSACATRRASQYYNDSKGTNVASTVKALESFAERIVLIAGGKGKGQDFAPLADAARGRVAPRRADRRGRPRDRSARALAPRGAAGDARRGRSMEAAVDAAARRGSRARRASCCSRRPAPRSTCSTTSSTGGRVQSIVVGAARCVEHVRASLPRHRWSAHNASDRWGGAGGGAALAPPSPTDAAKARARPVALRRGRGAALGGRGDGVLGERDRRGRPVSRPVVLPQEAALLGAARRRRACWAAIRVDYRRLERLVLPLLICRRRARWCWCWSRRSARPINGTRRWIRLGRCRSSRRSWPSSRSSLYLAAFLARSRSGVRTSRRGLLPPLAVAGLLAGLIRARSPTSATA